MQESILPASEQMAPAGQGGPGGPGKELGLAVTLNVSRAVILSEDGLWAPLV